MAESALIYPFPAPSEAKAHAKGDAQGDAKSGGKKSRRSGPAPVYFMRQELSLILDVYGRRVASGDWRDYAVDMGSSTASFLIYRRTSEAPLYRIIKDPSLARKQGTWRIVAMDGRVLKRGHDLKTTLKALDV